jgi:hypothetical protein
MYPEIMAKRFIWMLPGFLLGLFAISVLQYALHRTFPFPFYFLPGLSGAVSVWLAERKKMVPTIEELRRPISILDEHP